MNFQSEHSFSRSDDSREQQQSDSEKEKRIAFSGVLDARYQFIDDFSLENTFVLYCRDCEMSENARIVLREDSKNISDTDCVEMQLEWKLKRYKSCSIRNSGILKLEFCKIY